DDRQTGARTEPNELDMAKRLRLARGRDRNRKVLGQIREQSRRLLDDPLELAAGRAEPVENPALVLARERYGAHELVDVRPVAGIRGDSPRRRVRLDEVTCGLELVHLVPDRSRTHAQIIFLR